MHPSAFALSQVCKAHISPLLKFESIVSATLKSRDSIDKKTCAATSFTAYFLTQVSRDLGRLSHVIENIRNGWM